MGGGGNELAVVVGWFIRVSEVVNVLDGIEDEEHVTLSTGCDASPKLSSED